MSNEIVKTTQDALSIGEVFYKSGMFSDIKSAQQAVVKIMAGQEMGISPFAAMSGIHIIQGKPSIGAGLMAARVKGFGKYDYRVVKHDESVCSIDFYQGKEKIGNSSFTISDAKKAQTKNLDKFPKNMLFARAMSNGVRWFTPDIYESPVYVPEELEAIQPVEEVAEIVEGILPESVYLEWIEEALSIEDLTTLKKKIPAKGWTKTTIAAATEKHSELTTPVSETFTPENL